MPKFYQTEEFRALNAEWRKRLEDERFPDIEDERENLKKPDIRTQNFENRDKIHEFYRKLDKFISSKKKFPRNHRKILTLYSSGLSIRKISAKIHVDKSTVGEIVKQYKEKVLSLPI